MMSSLKDGIDNVVISFDEDNETSVFYAGTTMTGNVLLVMEETTAVRGIRLKIMGNMEIHWKKMDGGNTIENTELEDYLDEEITIWAPSVLKPEEKWLFPGEHNFRYGTSKESCEKHENADTAFFGFQIYV